MDSETTRSAVVDANNVAVNLVIVDANSIPPDGCQFVELQDEQPFDIGWVWDGISFTNPQEQVQDGSE